MNENSSQRGLWAIALVSVIFRFSFPKREGTEIKIRSFFRNEEMLCNKKQTSAWLHSVGLEAEVSARQTRVQSCKAEIFWGNKTM